ncbi:VOC family protein [Herbiconiux sp. CPCC 205716]|uniref:VOC family protein n=1 Tax=Herbiconiux gentiana TaxID=2970912 RepID=A0ABT2GCS0_9MICO|nr:VOC family protein [Herbiconiux gentiana]MCS5713982.1 VOC family protein [Herbiconiux gentiana]
MSDDTTTPTAPTTGTAPSAATPTAPTTGTAPSAATPTPTPTTGAAASAATGLYTTHGLPHGSTSLTPHLVVSPAEAALTFYRDVLGARVVDVTRFAAPDGSELVAHVVLDFGTGQLTLGDALPDYGLVAPDPAAGSSFSLALYRPDVDAVTAAAEAAGATVREQPATFVSGDRFASILDPFGVRWSIMTRVEDVSPEESARRVAEWAATQSA